jgi:hypothetical protein
MEFDVYCDESRPELLGSDHPSDSYVVIGSLWLPRQSRDRVKVAIHELRETHRIGPEFKWQKISRSRQPFYFALVDLFAGNPDIRFRCIAIDRSEVDLIRFHESDPELGFYRFYYQLLHHWILDFNRYAIFCDFKTNRSRSRLSTLRRCLGYSNLSATVEAVQAVRSEESVLMQFADVLTGIAASRMNGSLQPASARDEVAAFLEDRLGRRVAPTSRSEQKFNMFKIRLSGGW